MIPQESWYWNKHAIRQDHFHLRDYVGWGTLTVEHDIEDPTNYTAWGYWMEMGENKSEEFYLEIGSIATGPDFDEPANYVSSLSGSATYSGNFLGQAFYSKPTIGQVSFATYQASAKLVANFDNDTVSACIGCNSAALYDYEVFQVGVGRTEYEQITYTDLSIVLGPTSITNSGNFQSSNVAVQGNDVTTGKGVWAGRFTSVESTIPQDALGIVRSSFTRSDDGAGIISGGFYVIDESMGFQPDKR